MIKFQKFYVTDGAIKARVWYKIDGRTDGRSSVTLYAKDYDGNLGKIFPGDEYQNNTDLMTDYFEKGRVVLFAGHKLYPAALLRAASK